MWLLCCRERTNCQRLLKCVYSSMALQRQAGLLILVWVSLVSATFFKNPPPASNGCYKGRTADGDAINVQAVFDMGGVRGYVQFYQPGRGEPTEINVNLRGLEQFGGFYPWHAHDFPVRNALLKDFPCSRQEIGGHYDPTDAGSNPNYDTDCNPGNQGACEIGDFGGKHGFLRNDQQFQTFTDTTLDLYGPRSVIGRALVIHYPGVRQDRFICANIEPAGCRVKNLRAEFNNSVLQGEVVIRYAFGEDAAKIFVDLYQVNADLSARNKTWTLHFGSAGEDNSCIGLRREIAGDSPLHDFPDCTMEEHRQCRFGDLVTKCGPLQVNDGSRQVRLCCTDTQLGLIPFDTLFNPRNNHYISLRIADEGATEPDGCARFDKVIPQVARVNFKGKDLKGSIIFYQASPLDRTFIQPSIRSIRQRDISLVIRENRVTSSDCDNLGDIFSKTSTLFGRPLPSSGIKTGDASLIGNLDSAIPIPVGTQSTTDRSSSQYLPLFGPHSIIGRSLVVVENVPDAPPRPLACGNIERTSDDPSGVFASFNGYSP